MIVWRIFDEKLPFINEALKINHHVHGYVATLLIFSLTYCCYFTLTDYKMIDFD